MTVITRHEYSDNEEITSTVADETNDFLWVAFAKNSDNNCIIKKVGFQDPLQIFFTIERTVDEVIEMTTDGTNIYVAYDDSVLLGEIFPQNNPLTSAIEISKGSIIESPIDIAIDGTDLWFLLPGNASGTNAQLLKYNTAGILQQTVDLNKSGAIVNNARSMTIDTIGDIYIGTFEDPAKIIRVFAISGGLFDFTIDETLI